MERLLIRNATVVRPEGSERSDVLVSGETIEQIGPSLSAEGVAQVVEAEGMFLLPGAIDPHTHMGVPIKNGWSADDFRTGSRAALHGGVTTIIDFTHLEENETLLQSIARRCRQSQSSHADVALHVNVTRSDDGTLVEIPALVDRGFISFKVFTTYREAGLMLEYDEIAKVAETVAEAGGLLMVHAEDDGVIREATARLDSSSTDPAFHAKARPAESERVAVQRLAAIAESTNCPLYIVHLSSPAGLHAAKNSPVPIHLETCPQYLLLDDSCYSREDGRMYVASPALRSMAEAGELLEALLAGQFSTLGTDHCPFRLEDKPSGLRFGDIPNGLGGVETLVPLMLAQFVRRGAELSLLSSLLSERPASIFGLSPRKGRIEEGADADLMLVHPDDLLEDGASVKRETAADWDAYAGLPLLFPRTVWRRGERVVEAGQLFDPGPGEFLTSCKQELL